MRSYYWTDSVFVKHILLHISGLWLIRVRLVHSWAGPIGYKNALGKGSRPEPKSDIWFRFSEIKWFQAKWGVRMPKSFGGAHGQQDDKRCTTDVSVLCCRVDPDASKICPCTPTLAWVTSQPATTAPDLPSDREISSCVDAGLHASQVFLLMHSCIFLPCAHQAPESLLRLPTSNMTILPSKQAACDFCGLHGRAMRRLPLEDWRVIVLWKTWRCGRNAHVQIYISIGVYLCLHLYYIHMKWHVFAYDATPGSSSDSIYIQKNS